MQIRGYKVAQLRGALQEEGLSTKGLKAELVERLYELVQTLSQDAEVSRGGFDLPDTAERSLQAEVSGTSPEDPAQDTLRSHMLDDQSESPELNEGATAGDNRLASFPETAAASDAQHSAGAAGSSEENAKDQLVGLHTADAQRRLGSHESAAAALLEILVSQIRLPQRQVIYRRSHRVQEWSDLPDDVLHFQLLNHSAAPFTINHNEFQCTCGHG